MSDSCTAMINGRYSLSGKHNWELTGHPKQKDREIRCHFCGNFVPKARRSAMMDIMLAHEAQQAAQRKAMATLRKVMKGPARSRRRD